MKRLDPIDFGAGMATCCVLWIAVLSLDYYQELRAFPAPTVEYVEDCAPKPVTVTACAPCLNTFCVDNQIISCAEAIGTYCIDDIDDDLIDIDIPPQPAGKEGE